MWLVLLLLLLAIKPGRTQVGQFYNPPAAATTLAESTDYTENLVWTEGTAQTINYTTTYTNYTIQLWQQSLANGGEATISTGPVLFETTTGDFTEFQWAVQTYTLDLCDSNMFFLWLHEGDLDSQGSATSLSVQSHFFNITSPSGTSSCTSTSPTTTSRSSSTAGSPSTTTRASTAQESDTTAITATKESSSKISTTSQSTVLSTSKSDTTDTSTSSPTDTHPASPTDTTKPVPHGGLPTGTIVGIVIGVCLFGVPGLLGCLLYFWRHRKKAKTGDLSPDDFLKAGKGDDDQELMSTGQHPNGLELHSHSIKGELMAEPFFRGHFQELHERYVRPDLELLAEPFFRDRVQEVHGHSCGPELHSHSCGPELPAEAALRSQLRECHRRPRKVDPNPNSGTEPWAGNWAELGFRAELP